MRASLLDMFVLFLGWKAGPPVPAVLTVAYMASHCSQRFGSTKWSVPHPLSCQGVLGCSVLIHLLFARVVSLQKRYGCGSNMGTQNGILENGTIGLKPAAPWFLVLAHARMFCEWKGTTLRQVSFVRKSGELTGTIPSHSQASGFLSM